MPPFLVRLLKLRHDPNPWVRRVWWFGAVTLLGLLVAPVVTVNVAAGVWLLFNLGLVLTASAWAVFHPRSIVTALGPAGIGSFWMALIGALWISTSFSVLLSEQMPELVTPLARTLLVLGFPVLLAALLLVAFGLALVAAALGAFTGRRQRSPEAPRFGVAAGWIAFAVMVLAGALGDLLRLPEIVPTVIGGSGPALIAFLTRKGLHTGCSPAEMRERGMDWLARRLIRRWQVGGRARRLDLRGPALGVAAALVGAVLAYSPALLPLQSRFLVAGLQGRNGVERSLRHLPRAVAPAAPVRVALLEMDLEARRLAATTSSEAAIQARMIRKLSAYGARVVLPLPLVDPLDGPERVIAAQSQGELDLLPNETDLRRTLQNLDDLVAACRSAGSVYLAVPTRHDPGPKVEEARALARLSTAAAGVGQAELESFGAPELPVLSTGKERGSGRPEPLAPRYPPLPLLLTTGPTGPEALVGLPQIAPAKVLVTVRATQPGQSFPRVGYGSVLRNEPLLLSASEAGGSAGRWVRPEEFFRGRIVFLDSLLPHNRDTVAGRTPQAEVQAHALATLHTRITTGRAPIWVSLVGLLLAGLITGAACTGRDPLQASWIAGGIELGALAISNTAFLAPMVWSVLTGRGAAGAGSLWLDPVAPMLVILATYLLTANLTLAVERAQRARNKSLLQRFVAPQVVEELLDEMEDFDGELGLGGKRQTVCVLFADVRGFTRFAEAQSPEVVIGVMNQYLTALTEALHRHGGLLDKYLGDGLLALFRVQDPYTDVRKAVQAALAMRDAAFAVSARQAVQNGPVLQVGISLHYGDAVVGLVGNPEQFNYTALGHTVVVSQRLQSVAGAGEVILSEAVFAAIQGQIDAEVGTPVSVKGLSQPVCYYRIPNPAGAALTEGQKVEA